MGLKAEARPSDPVFLPFPFCVPQHASGINKWLSFGPSFFDFHLQPEYESEKRHYKTGDQLLQ